MTGRSPVFPLTCWLLVLDELCATGVTELLEFTTGVIVVLLEEFTTGTVALLELLPLGLPLLLEDPAVALLLGVTALEVGSTLADDVIVALLVAVLVPLLALLLALLDCVPVCEPVSELLEAIMSPASAEELSPFSSA